MIPIEFERNSEWSRIQNGITFEELEEMLEGADTEDHRFLDPIRKPFGSSALRIVDSDPLLEGADDLLEEELQEPSRLLSSEQVEAFALAAYESILTSTQNECLALRAYAEVFRNATLFSLGAPEELNMYKGIRPEELDFSHFMQGENALY